TTAAAGVLAGALSQAAFALAYGWTSLRRGAGAALAAATAAFLAATLVWTLIPLSPVEIAPVVVLGLVAAIRIMPGSSAERPAPTAPGWDIPLRMAIATALVLALTSAAPLLGARLAGLLAPYPLFAAVMALFAHRSAGADASRDVLRGLLYGLFAFAAFYAVAALTLAPA